MKRKHRKFLWTISALTLILLIVFAIYVSDFYRADQNAINALDSSIAVNGNYAFIPENPKAGFIFYPGGKVECEAYAPLMKELYENGYLCIIARMPINLSEFKSGAADSIISDFPDIEKWYIGGHSLGGSMAASYADTDSNRISGLVLLAAYSTADLTDNNIKVLSIYGTEDHIMNKDNYNNYFDNLPDDMIEVLIDGGNHSQFGSYGHQNGDGLSSITEDEQVKITAELIMEFIK